MGSFICVHKGILLEIKNLETFKLVFILFVQHNLCGVYLDQNANDFLT